MSNIISYSEIVIHPGSSGKSGGGAFVFVYNGKYYRAIPKYREEYIDKINDIIKNLSTPKLTKTNLKLSFLSPKLITKTNLKKLEKTIDNYVIYKKSYSLRYVNHMCFSSSERIIDFISTLCDTNMSLIKDGYIYNDVHEGNIADTEMGIVLFDIDAIEPISNYSANCAMNSTFCLLDKYVFDEQTKEEISSIIKNYNPSTVQAWEVLKNKLNEKKSANLPCTHWADQYAIGLNSDNIINGKGQKETGILKILDSIDYGSVIDFGCNKGYYTLYAAKKCKDSMGIDTDAKCISIAIQEAKKHNLSTVFSTMSIGLINDIFIKNGYDNIKKIKYLESDLAMALAIVHHISIAHENFAKILSTVSKKYIIIEDVGTANIYENIFVKDGFALVKRVISYPNDRTISLYKK